MERPCYFYGFDILELFAFARIRVFADCGDSGQGVGRGLRVCYTDIMFIHRISITGCSDRGAWPWRTRQGTSARA